MAAQPVLAARLLVHVQPRAKRTEVAGRHGDALKIRLAAAPEDGAANDELVRFVAEQLGLPRRAVSLASGHTSRRKLLVIEGASGDVAAQLERATA